MSSLRIDPARAADVDALADLEASAMGAEAWSRASVAAEVAAAADGRVVLVARDGGTDDLVGWVDLAVAGDVADLLRVAVAPVARRRGAAGALLRQAYAVLPVAVDRVLLEVAASNSAARALYADQGFTEIARRAGYYRDGGDALVMQRARHDGADLARTTTLSGGRP